MDHRSDRPAGCCSLLRPALLCIFLASLGTASYRPPWASARQTFRCFADRATLANGYYESVSNGNSVIKAQCNDGYHLLGSAIRHCNEEEQRYSGTSPICVDVDECALMEEGSGSGSGGNNDDNDDNDLRRCHVHATCKNTEGGYTCNCRPGLVGNGYYCREPPCPQLPEIENGQVRRHAGNENFAVVSCDPDCRRIGPSPVRCVNNRWFRVPRCEPKPRCPDPGPLENGEVVGENFYPGNSIHYVCGPGFEMLGPNTRRCTDTFRWRPYYPPICKRPKTLADKAVDLREQLEEIAKNSASSPQHVSLARFSLNQPNGIDLFLLFDGSSSVRSKNFKLGVNFTDILLTELGVSNTTGTTRVAAMAFGSETKVAVTLGQYASIEEVRQQLATLQPPGGGTNLADALSVVDRAISLDRNYAAQKRIMFIMSDGRSNVGTEEATRTRTESLRKRKKVEIYTIGVGNDVDRGQLEEFASKPVQEHVYMLNNYKQLTDLRELVLDRRKDYEQCGISGNTEIVDSDKGDTKEGSWPWLVQIYERLPDGQEKMVCGGTLICDQWVLTAAQCFQTRRADTDPWEAIPAGKFRVRVGVYNWTDTGNARVLTFDVSDIYRYSAELRGDLKDDIAVIRLSGRVQLAKYYRTLCVPRNDSQDVVNRLPWRERTEKTLYVAGWGTRSAPTPQYPDFEVPKQQLTNIQQSRCATFLRNVTHNNPSEKLSCTGERSYESCRGDVGGPVMTERSEDRHFIQVGVVSHNRHCRTARGATVMTNTLTYLDWIRRTAGDCVDKHNCRGQQC